MQTKRSGTRATLTVVTVCAVATLGLVAGCGEDEEANSSLGPTAGAGDITEHASAPLSRRGFTRKAEAICISLKAKLDALDRGSPGAEGAAELQAFAGAAVDEVRTALGEVRALVPPRRLRTRVEALLEAAEDGAAKLNEAAASQKEAQALLEGARPFAAVDGHARRLRLPACVGVA